MLIIKMALSIILLKCTGRTSSKSGPISSDIVPTKIEDNSKFNYHNYSSSTLLELPFHKIFSNLTKNSTI